MNTDILKNIWTDLVEKKLILVVVPLVALLVAVPMMLSKPGDVATASVETPQVDLSDDGPQLALTRTATTGFARPARVNDKRIDPFATKLVGTTTKKVADAIEKQLDQVGSSGGGGTGGGGSAPSVSLPKPTKEPKPKPTKEPKPTTPDEPETVKDDLLSILVTDQSGETSVDPVEMTDIRTLTPLTDPEAPFLVYVGKTASGAASFLVSADVKFSGDGACAPSPQDCRTLTMQIGETAEFSLVADQSKKIAITITDIETKDVVVEDDEEGTKTAVRLENKARRAGVKALRSVLTDDEVVKSLARQRIKIRP